MEQIKLENSLGFFASCAAALGVAGMLFELSVSTLISLYQFSFIIVVFAAAIGLRALTWRRIYADKKSLHYLFLFMLVPVLGAALLILFFLFGQQQLILYPPSHYAGQTLLIYMAAIWSVYSLLEFWGLLGVFTGKLRKIITVQPVAIIFMDISIVWLGGLSDYILPLAFLLLAAATATIGISFLKAEGSETGAKERRLVS